MKPYNFNNIVNLPNTKEFITGYRKQISSKDENEFIKFCKKVLRFFCSNSK